MQASHLGSLSCSTFSSVPCLTVCEKQHSMAQVFRSLQSPCNHAGDADEVPGWWHFVLSYQFIFIIPINVWYYFYLRWENRFKETKHLTHKLFIGAFRSRVNFYSGISVFMFVYFVPYQVTSWVDQFCKARSNTKLLFTNKLYLLKNHSGLNSCMDLQKQQTNNEHKSCARVTIIIAYNSIHAFILSYLIDL